MLTDKDLIEYHLDEIKNIREELNWRVKLMYTSNVAIISLVIFGFSLFLENNNLDDIRDNLLIANISIAISILLCMYGGILNANHLVEKRMELYILTLQKKIYSVTDEPIFSWLGFLYNNPSKSKFLKTITLVSHIVFGLFQYLLPSLLSTVILISVHSIFDLTSGLKAFIIIAWILTFVTFVSSLGFLLYFNQVQKSHSKFYDKISKHV